MSKFFVLSDIHIDQYISACGVDGMKSLYNRFFSQIKDIDESVLLCAGDVSGTVEGWLNVGFIFEKFKKVILVLGNHDMVRFTDGDCKRLKKNGYEEYYKVKHTTENKVEWIKKYIKDNFPNVTLLDGECIDYEGIKIGGTFGWYDYLDDESPLDEMDWHDWYDGFYWNYYNQNLKTIAYNEVKKMKKVLEDKPDIFITHVAHDMCNTNPMYRGSSSNKFFYYSPDEYDLSSCKCIICGHTHDSVKYVGEYEAGKYDSSVKYNHTILCNPMGYCGEVDPLKLNRLKLEDFLFEVEGVKSTLQT